MDMLNDTDIKKNRGIVVDKHMKTNIKNVYAAGDVCETTDILSGNQRLIPILPGAYKQGEVAGINMAGAEADYEGSLAMNSIGFFGLPMITAGIVRPEGDGFEILEKVDKQNYSLRKIVLKQNRIVGFIMINNVDRAGIITNLIKENVDVSDFKDRLLNNDFGYADMPKKYRKEKLIKVRTV